MIIFNIDIVNLIIKWYNTIRVWVIKKEDDKFYNARKTLAILYIWPFFWIEAFKIHNINLRIYTYSSCRATNFVSIFFIINYNRIIWSMSKKISIANQKYIRGKPWLSPTSLNWPKIIVFSSCKKRSLKIDCIVDLVSN